MISSSSSMLMTMLTITQTVMVSKPDSPGAAPPPHEAEERAPDASRAPPGNKC